MAEGDATRTGGGTGVREGDPAARSVSRAGLRTLVRDLVAFDLKSLLILAYVPLALTTMEYVFLPQSAYKQPAPEWVGTFLHDVSLRWPSIPIPLLPWLWWGTGCLGVMVLVPMLLLGALTRTSPRDTGLRLKGTAHDAWIYVGLFVIFAPVVWLVSQRTEFRLTYPFYRGTGRYGSDLVVFEAAYFLQFLAVEYFFRGFMVLGLKPALGRASILVMLAPYCMIHFHKPMLEAMGAIGAGVVLGSLSWRTGTVVYGWFLHYGVALTMDLLSLKASGRI